MRHKLLVFFIVINLFSFAQNPAIDSLTAIVKGNEHDTLKCLAYSDLCWENRLIDQNLALVNGHKGLNLSRKIGFRFGEGRNLNDLSIIYIDRGNLDTAIILLNEAKEIRTELNDPIGVAAIHNKLGIIYEHQVKLENALKEHLAALEIFEEEGIQPNVGFCLNNIGNVHFKMSNYDKALEIHNKALVLRQSIDDEYGIAGSHSNIANTYQFMGDTTQAISHYDQAIQVYRRNDFKNDLAVTLNNLGSLYISMGDVKKALPLVNEAYEIRIQLNDARGIASSSILLGEIYTELNQFKKAQNLLHKSLIISKESGFFNKEKGAYEKLAKLYKKMNLADSVYFYYDLFYQKEKELYQENLNSQVNDLQTSYETEKKDRLNEKLEKEKALETARRKTAELEVSQRNILILGIGGFVVLATLLALIFFQRFRRIQEEKRSKAVLQERDKGLKAVIQTQESERERISQDLHDGIGQQLSGLKLAWSGLSTEIGKENPQQFSKLIELTGILDQSADEVRNISHQMMPKLLKEYGLIAALNEMLEKALKFSKIEGLIDDLNIGEKRFNDEVEIGLYRVGQELVNNAIKHAGASSIELQVYLNQGNLHLLVIDNGKGMPLNEDTEGHGLRNIKSRLSIIQGTISFETEQGTTAHVVVPIP